MSRTETPAETPQPSIEERVNALKGEAADIWKFKGDLAAAEAKNSELQPPAEAPAELDVPSDSSPDTPSGEATEQVPENEAASEPAEVEQPVKGETPEQKSERRKRANERHYQQLLKERAEYKAELELLKKQYAEKNAAPAPAKEQPKTKLERPKPPKMTGHETAEEWDAKNEAYADQLADYFEQVAEAKVQSYRSQTDAEKIQAAYEDRKRAAKAKYADLESKPYFAKDFQGSEALNYVITTHPEGFDYAYALDAKNAKRIAEMTHIPDIWELSQKDPARAAALYSKAVTVAEYELKALSKPAAAPPRQPTGQKPTSEVRLDRPGSPVADVRAKAIADGDFRTFKAQENAKLRKA